MSIFSISGIFYFWKFSGTDVGRTRDLRFTRATPYHLATAPRVFDENIWCDDVNTKCTILYYAFVKESAFDSIVRANRHHLFTSAIPLLLSAGTFACCVSALGRYVPHYRTRWVAISITSTMLTLSLAWTPDRHRQLPTSGPELKPFASLACK